MNKHKEGIASDGQLLHYSVGAIVKKNDKYLLIDRVNIPLGFAGLAGHIDDDEPPEVAIKREVMEESGLSVSSCKILFEEEILWNYCSSAKAHKWWLYECEVQGTIAQNKVETKSIGWYTKEEIKNLNL